MEVGGGRLEELENVVMVSVCWSSEGLLKTRQDRQKMKIFKQAGSDSGIHWNGNAYAGVILPSLPLLLHACCFGCHTHAHLNIRTHVRWRRNSWILKQADATWEDGGQRRDWTGRTGQGHVPACITCLPACLLTTAFFFFLLPFFFFSPTFAAFFSCLLNLFFPSLCSFSHACCLIFVSHSCSHSALFLLLCLVSLCLCAVALCHVAGIFSPLSCRPSPCLPPPGLFFCPVPAAPCYWPTMYTWLCLPLLPACLPSCVHTSLPLQALPVLCALYHLPVPALPHPCHAFLFSLWTRVFAHMPACHPFLCLSLMPHAFVTALATSLFFACLSLMPVADPRTPCLVALPLRSRFLFVPQRTRTHLSLQAPALPHRIPPHTRTIFACLLSLPLPATLSQTASLPSKRQVLSSAYCLLPPYIWKKEEEEEKENGRTRRRREGLGLGWFETGLDRMVSGLILFL